MVNPNLPPAVDALAPPAPAGGDQGRGEPPSLHGTTARAHGLAGTDLSSAIYGSLLVTVLLVVENRKDAVPALVGVSVLAAIAAFWLTDVWAGLVSLRMRGPITRAETRAVAVAESPMLAAAVVPELVLVAGTVGLLAPATALDVAVGVAVVQLFLWGLAVGHAVGQGWRTALVVATVDLVLGLLIVALKVFVLH